MPSSRRPADAGEDQDHGEGQLLDHGGEDRPVGEHVGAEVAGQHAPEEAQHLHDHRLIQPHLDAEGGADRRRRERPEQHRSGIAGDELDRTDQGGERDRRDGDRKADAPQRVA